jgi:hypothetical protein
MGASAAIGAGMSVVGGVLGLGQKQKEAAAQRKMLDAQEAQQQLQAQLQLFALKNQRVVDNLQDTLTDAAQKQAYMQTDAGLKLQQQMNQLATQNAIFGSQVQALQGDARERSEQMQAAGQRSGQVSSAEQGLTEALGSLSGEQGQLISSLLEGIGKAKDPRTALATLLDTAASSGGVNEALQMLLGEGEFAAEQNASALSRAESVAGKKSQSAKAVKEATVGLAGTGEQLALANAGLENQNTQFNSRLGELDARTAEQVANNAFASQALANKQNYETGIMATNLQKQSRYLQSQASEEALKLGQALSSDTIAAQKQSISSPGLFDYLGVGLNAYNTYNQLSYVPPTLRRNK